MKHGIVTEISGPVVDVRFAEGELPSINEALTLTAEGRTYTMEVEQHLTGDTVRCIMMSGSDGLSRGMTAPAIISAEMYWLLTFAAMLTRPPCRLWPTMWSGGYPSSPL